MKLFALAAMLLVMSQGCATTNRAAANRVDLGQTGVAAALRGFEVHIFTMSRLDTLPGRIEANLTLLNRTESPVVVTANAVTLVDSEGRSVSGVGEGTRESTSAKSPERPTPNWVRALQIATIPQQILMCLYLIPLCVAQGIVTAATAGSSGSDDTGAAVFTWDRLDLAPGDATTIWVSFVENGIDFAHLRMMRFAISGTDGEVELPLRY